MTGMIADVGERASIIRRRRLPSKLLVASLTSLCLLISAVVIGNANSGASDAPAAQEWQPRTIYLQQTSLTFTSVGSDLVATYHLRWNSSHDFSALNWSAVDKSNTAQKYVLGLGAKIWVSRANITSDFPIEITQGDGASLNYVFNYTLDQESPHIYLTGERNFWKWERTPDIVYDYVARGSCCIEDAWRNGTWSPEEGISLKYDPEGTLILGKCDFAVQLLVYDVMVPEFGSILPIVALVVLGMIALERRKRAA